MIREGFDMVERERSFEECFEDLETIVNKLEAGELTLEESLAEYERGIKALRRCHEILAKAEKRIEMLIRDDEGKLAAVPFEEEYEPKKETKAGGEDEPTEEAEPAEEPDPQEGYLF